MNISQEHFGYRMLTSLIQMGVSAACATKVCTVLAAILLGLLFIVLSGREAVGSPGQESTYYHTFR